MQTLELVFPQWQGGDITRFFPELSAQEAAQGYYLGAQILKLLTESINPNLAKNSALVPISLELTLDSNGQRIVQEGIIDGAILQKQTKSALQILRDKNPDRILTLGGECATSIAPFSYLADKYKGDCVALIWLDAHPDLGLPHDDFYKGYHAMAVSALNGRLQEQLKLPAIIKSHRILLTGLHSHEAEVMKERQKAFGIKSLNSAESSAQNVLAFLAQSGAKKLLIHFDLDVLNPAELYAGVGNSGKMSIAQIMEIIEALNAEYDIIGLTIAEHLPKLELQLKCLLEKLPLIKNDQN